jgi:hypothetical protein
VTAISERDFIASIEGRRRCERQLELADLPEPDADALR